MIARIADTISPTADDHMVEIGPGFGALTGALLPSGCRLEAIELDRDLATPLLAAFSIYPGFTLHRADALRFDFASLLGDTTPTGSDQDAARAGQAQETRLLALQSGSPSQSQAELVKKLRIVGNLPYNISTPLLFRLLAFSDRIEDMHLMLQLEVVQRLTAAPGGKHWGRLAIMTQFRSSAELLFEVPPEAFDPPPRVQSAIVRLTPHAAPPYPDCDEAKLASVVKAAFAQRRKTLRNNLKGLIDSTALAEAGIDPSARAETLTMGDFARLAGLLSSREG